MNIFLEEENDIGNIFFCDLKTLMTTETSRYLKTLKNDPPTLPTLITMRSEQKTLLELSIFIPSFKDLQYYLYFYFNPKKSFPCVSLYIIQTLEWQQNHRRLKSLQSSSSLKIIPIHYKPFQTNHRLFPANRFNIDNNTLQSPHTTKYHSAIAQ